MNERIKDLRKILKLSQKEFGKRLGITGATVSRIEKKINIVTPAIEKLILREFNVNEEWLRNGTGEMFKAVPKVDEYFKAATELSIHGDDMAMQAVIEYWKLDEDSKKLLKDFILHIVEEIKDKE